ncbi:hypothetical protein [Nostoc sp.]
MSPRSQPGGWERILNGLLPLVKKEKAEPPGWEAVRARAVS